MPIYEYRCGACGREIEVQQKMSDPDLVHCEACGQDKLERLISWTSVRSNSWQQALHTDNPREAMKGLHAVDRSGPPKRAGAATATPAAATTTPAAETSAAAAPAAAAPASSSSAPAAPAPAASSPDADTGGDATDTDGEDESSRT